jgi:hypothetical protein
MGFEILGTNQPLVELEGRQVALERSSRSAIARSTNSLLVMFSRAAAW